MNKKVDDIIGYIISFAMVIVTFLIVTVIVYGGWLLSRKLNYSLSYKEQVIETMCAMIKPDALQNRSDCK